MMIFKTMACWSDLLGFSRQLEDSDWKLDSEGSKMLGARLINFASLINERSTGWETGNFINDALIRTLEKDTYTLLENRSKVRYWLDSCIMSHCLTAIEEANNKMPGVRTIICEGEVLQYEMNRESHARMPFKSVNSIPTELNTALSKCFISDQKGSKGIGLKLGGIYIEKQIINHLTNVFGYVKRGDFLFTDQRCIFLKNNLLYNSINQLYFIKDEKTRLLAEDAPHRMPWFKFGRELEVVHNNLRFQLVELEAYSPLEEFALCWHNCFTGDCFGISCGVAPTFEEEFKKLTKSLQKNSPEYKAVKLYCEKFDKKYIRYIDDDKDSANYELFLEQLREQTVYPN